METERKSHPDDEIMNYDHSFLASMVQSSDDAIIAKKLDGTITFWNKGAEKIYGYSSSEMVGKNISILSPSDRKDDTSKILEKVRKGEPLDHFETIRTTKDGKKITVSLTVSPIKDEKEKIIGASTIARNITEHKIFSEERLRLAAIVESSDDAILGMTLDGGVTSWNRGAERMFGYEAGEVIGKSVHIIYPDNQADELPQIIGKIRRGEHIEHHETQRKRKDGKLIDVSLSISTIKDGEKIIGISKIIRDITGQKRVAQYTRSLIEASLDPLVTISPDGKITDVNEATVQATGVERTNLLGTDFSNYFTEPEKAREGYRQVFSKEKVIDYPLTIRHISGRTIDVLYNASVYRDYKGNVLGVFAAARDVTSQKKVEVQLHSTSAYARSLIEASLDPLVTISPDGKITDVNEATVQATGVTREKLIGSDFSSYFTEPEEARDGYERAFKEGFVIDYPLTIRHASGELTDVLYNATVYKDEKGKVLGVFAAARDVTERKKVEEQLHATSAYARSLIEASIDPLVTISPDGKITDVNHATELITGVSREWLIGTDFSTYFTLPSRARKGYRLAFQEGSVRDFPLALRHASGSITDVLYNATVYRDATGKVRGIFAAARDVTETKKVTQYTRSLIEASLDPLVTISPDGKITDVNEATVQATGVERTKLLGTDFSNYFTEPEEARKGYELAFKEGFVTDYPLTIHSTGGKLTDVLYNATVYKDEKGNVLGVFAAARDYSRVKQTTRELEESNKELEKINKEKEEFAAMISHELKTPLVPIQGYSELLYTGKLGELTEKQADSVKIIFDNSTRLSRLIQDILDIRKIELSKLKLDKVDASTKAIVDQCIDVFKKAADVKGVALVSKVQDITLKCDPERILQVLNNLVGNSLKFVPPSTGRVEINTKLNNSMVVFAIEDNGIGIPKEMQQGLFKKFYQVDTSLERNNKGTGLGLAISKGIVESHGGKIWVESDKGKGTKIYFSIPMGAEA